MRSGQLKGKYHENLMSFQNPKMFVRQQKQPLLLDELLSVPPRFRPLARFSRSLKQARDRVGRNGLTPPPRRGLSYERGGDARRLA